jgi:arylsulfatase A
VYAQDLFQARAVRFIKQHCNEPFFLYYPVTIPHASIQTPPEAIQGYLGQFPEKPFKGDRYAAQPTPNAALAAMISDLDKNIGELRKLLRLLGIERNTVFFFLSDNGPASMEGRDPAFFDATGQFRGQKGDLLEGGIGMPFIIDWPGTITPGRQSDEMLAMWDVMPTLSTLVNKEPPGDIDGISFSDLLTNRG